MCSEINGILGDFEDDEVVKRAVRKQLACGVWLESGFEARIVRGSGALESRLSSSECES